MNTLNILLAATVSLLAAIAAPAAVSSHPLDMTTGSNWRTAATPPFESTGQYGAAGFVLFGINLPDNSYTGSGYDILAGNAANQYSLPAYISAVVVPAGVSYSMWSGNGNFGVIQNPAAGNALTPTTALLRSTRPGDPCDLKLQRATSDAFRLTILIGLSSDGGYPNSATTVTVDAGTAGSASANTGPVPNGGQPGTPSMTYLTFDIDAGTDDILVRLAGSGANLAGLAFDPLNVAVVTPVFTQQPASVSAFVGTPAQLSAAASGGQIAFQWYRGGAAVSGATNSSLVFPGLAYSDAGSYRVVATNSAGRATSDVAVVTVLVLDVNSYRAAVRSEPGLLSFYTFDAADAADSYGAHHGTLSGTTAFPPGLGGGTNQSLLLGAAGHVALGAVGDFEFTDGTGTVEAFVRADWSPASPPPYNPCLFANRDGGPTRWSIHLLQDKNQLAFWNGSTVGLVPIPNPGTNWHHCASVFDNGAWRVYWDGQLVGTTGTPLGGIGALPTQTGSSTAASTTEGWLGGLDEVAIYSTALSADAISAHYSALVSPKEFLITSATYDANQDLLTLVWNSVPGAGYTIENTQDFVHWDSLTAGITSQGGTTTRVIDFPTPGQFYRIRQY